MNLRVLLLVLCVAAGAFVGRLGAHQWGGIFEVPRAPDSSKWRIISPGLQEGIGAAGAGRVTHIRGGEMSIATHVFFRPDMVVPVFQGGAAGAVVELAPDSGTLWVQIGEAPSQFVQLRPGAMRGSTSGTEWTESGENRFVLSIENGELSVSSGTATMSAGRASVGRLELSASKEWPKIRSLLVVDRSGKAVFESDFGDRGANSTVLNQATALGSLVGLFSGVLLIPFSVSGLAAVAMGLALPAMVIMQPESVWLGAVERLYLKDIQPSQWAARVFLVTLLPLFWMGIVSGIRVVSHRINAPQKGLLVWCCVGAVSLALGAQHWHIGVAVVIGCMGLGALRAGAKGTPTWWMIDSIAWLPLAVFGAPLAAPWVVLWRIASLVGTASQWAEVSPRRAVDGLLIALVCAPFAVESAASVSWLGDAWRMDRLSAERPNERGWENPRPGWEGTCGSDDPQYARTIAFAGGSSVGGAYQFGDEPEAFFPAVAHRELCKNLPEGMALKTQNFGDGDLNTFTIARTIDAHLNHADVLVVYVGVNDVLTRQNTQTRKEREQARSQRGILGEGLSGWASESTVLVGISLWNRGIEDPTAEGVADVPLADAEENHQTIVEAARAQGKRVVLLTEHVHSGLADSLRPYAAMQRRFVAEDVVWVDSTQAFATMTPETVLVDRNHLSREGNAALGRHLSEALAPLVHGSKR